jgi:signal transduction histidine kinase/ligand-binding sensor domain-containing protein
MSISIGRSNSVVDCGHYLPAIILAATISMFTIASSQALAQDLPLRLTQFSHTAWRSQEGYFDGMPIVISQTSDGYLWIGTASGLVRFDGAQFVNWKESIAKSSTQMSVYSLLGASDGSLLIGTSRALMRLKDGTLAHVKDAIGRINGIIEDSKGTIWIARTRMPDKKGPLCKVQGENMQCVGEAEGLTCPYGTDLRQDQQGTLWMGSYPGVCNWTSQRSEAYLPNGTHQGDTKVFANSVATPSDSPVLVGFVKAGKGLGLETLVNGRWNSYNVSGLVGSQVAVTSLMVSHRGELWVGTADQGIFHVTHGIADHYGSEAGLTDDQINGFYEDREGSVWVATASGVDRFHPIAISEVSTREGLVSDKIHSVGHLADGRIIAAGVGGLSTIDERHISSITPSTGFPGRAATSLLIDREGRVWIGVDDRLTLYKNGKFTDVNTVDGSPTGQVKQLAEDTEHAIWVLTAKGLFKLEGGRPREVHLPGATISPAIAADPKGGIWIRPNKASADVIHYAGSVDQGMTIHSPSNNFSRFFGDDDGSLWLMGDGLSHWRNGAWSKLDSTNGLPCDNVTNVVKGALGSWWIYTSCGLVVVPEAELRRWANAPASRLEPARIFVASDGAHTQQPSFSPNSAMDSDGNLWFADDGKLQVVEAAHPSINTVAPPVHVQQVVADRVVHERAPMIQLPALTRDVTIDYAALSLVNPRSVLFKYKLSGIDQDWREVHDRRQAFYTNLGPGGYVFRVIACNNNGVWNAVGDQVSFTIAPAFYQTIWFRIAMICTGLAAIWTVFRLRLRAATASVESRLSERLLERERIARDLHDTFFQGIQGLLLMINTAVNRMREEEPIRAVLQDALKRSDQVMAEGRQLVLDLRAESNAGAPLSDALALVGSEFTNVYEVPFEVSVMGDPVPLHPIVYEETYRLAREAISNAFQHAKASSIEVKIAYERTTFRINVRDNGVGLDPDVTADGSRPQHWGLPGMRERAKKIGAAFTLWSGPNAGTEIEVRMPATVAYRRRPMRFGPHWLRKALKIDNATVR